MKRTALVIAVILITSFAFTVTAGSEHRTVEVDSYSLDDGTLEVLFSIYADGKAGTFTWEVSYDYAGVGRTDTRTQSWAAGATTASGSMFLGSDAKVKTVRVTKAETL